MLFVSQHLRFSDKKKDLPGDIDSAIKALFELYDPLKKGALFCSVDSLLLVKVVAYRGH